MSSLPLDESTCCDEDFTWVKSESNTPKASPQKEPVVKVKSFPIASPSTSSSVALNGNGKPPRPVGSLDRRRQLTTNREERDHKSRSAHSLKEKGSSSDLKEMKNKAKHQISRTGSFEVRKGSNSSESGFGMRPVDFHRTSPGFWEPPPPPAFPYYWDGYHFWPSSCHASREELRGVDYNGMGAHRRPLGPSGGPAGPHEHHTPHHHPQRYGSSNTLSASQQDLSCGPYCGRFAGPPAPHAHGYCGCEGNGGPRPYHPHHSTSSLWNQVGRCVCCN